MPFYPSPVTPSVNIQQLSAQVQHEPFTLKNLARRKSVKSPPDRIRHILMDDMAFFSPKNQTHNARLDINDV